MGPLQHAQVVRVEEGGSSGVRELRRDRVPRAHSACVRAPSPPLVRFADEDGATVVGPMRLQLCRVNCTLGIRAAAAVNDNKTGRRRDANDEDSGDAHASAVCEQPHWVALPLRCTITQAQCLKLG